MPRPSATSAIGGCPRWSQRRYTRARLQPYDSATSAAGIGPTSHSGCRHAYCTGGRIPTMFCWVAATLGGLPRPGTNGPPSCHSLGRDRGIGQPGRDRPRRCQLRVRRRCRHGDSRAAVVAGRASCRGSGACRLPRSSRRPGVARRPRPTIGAGSGHRTSPPGASWRASPQSNLVRHFTNTRTA